MTMRRYLDFMAVGLTCVAFFWLGTAVCQVNREPPAKSSRVLSALPEVIPTKTLAGGAGVLEAHNLGRPTLLFVLSADCRYCEQSAPQWRGLVASLGDADSPLAMFALSLSDAEATTRYLEANDLEVPALLIEPAQLPGLGLRGVPGTVALDPASSTMRSWIGVLSESEAETILTWAKAD
jgi:hypothetical protein